MTVATFLVLVQILYGLGGTGVAILTITKDIEDQGLQPDDPLPAEHVATIKAAMGTGGSVWDEIHQGEGG